MNQLLTTNEEHPVIHNGDIFAVLFINFNVLKQWNILNDLSSFAVRKLAVICQFDNWQPS